LDRVSAIDAAQLASNSTMFDKLAIERNAQREQTERLGEHGPLDEEWDLHSTLHVGVPGVLGEEWAEPPANAEFNGRHASRVTVQQVLTNARGRVFGLLLSNGASVAFAPRFGRELAAHGVRSGEAVQVHGHGGTWRTGVSMLAEQITFADGSMLAKPLPARASHRS